jgi:hypothetical protein
MSNLERLRVPPPILASITDTHLEELESVAGSRVRRSRIRQAQVTGTHRRSFRLVH